MHGSSVGFLISSVKVVRHNSRIFLWKSFGRASGTRFHFVVSDPPLETAGYFQASLRDAIDEPGCGFGSWVAWTKLGVGMRPGDA